MIYLQPHRRPGGRVARTISVIVILIIVASVMAIVFIPHIFSGIFISIARPFWHTEFSVKSGSLKSPEQLLAENEELRRQIMNMEHRMGEVRFLEQKNIELESLIGHFVGTTTDEHGSSRVLLGAVLIRPPLSPYDELIIDIGEDDGVSLGDFVYASDILIGSISTVNRNTSRVRLFSSPGEKHQVIIGVDGFATTAIGKGGGQYQAQISRETSISEGDLVINSSSDNMPFGHISSIIRDQTQPFVTVLFSLPANLYQVRWVTVDVSHK